MKLSAPIYRLKRDARDRARAASVPLHAALDLIAKEEGYDRWSHLAARHEQASVAARLVSQLRSGELVLIAARPGRGKTMLALECAIEAARSGNTSLIFSLDYTQQQVLERLHDLGASPDALARIRIDCSELIAADTIEAQLSSLDGPVLAVVDYLQLLDQRRSTASLLDQIRALRRAAKGSGVKMLFISQIDRSFETSGEAVPGLADIRLPNPLDLALFDTAWFVGDTSIEVSTIGRP